MDLKTAIATVLCPRYPLGIEGLDFGDGGERPLPGGFCCFAVDLPDSLLRLAELRAHSGNPFPYACSDLERGAGQMIKSLSRLPPAAAFGAADSVDLARAAGHLTGTEARQATISLVFAPVVDVASEPRNPIVATRAFGATPDQVGRLAGAFARGCAAAGVLATAKHYPGHGSTLADSHLVLPRLDQTLHELETVDEAPFRTLIDQGIAAIMLGHLQVPAIDPHHPSSLSAAVIARLRHHLGFTGLVVTDALDMGAIHTGEGIADEPAVLTLAAGADIALLPRDPHRAARALLAAVETGILPQERIRNAAERIRSLIGSVEVPAEPCLKATNGGRELALQIARQSVVARRTEGNSHLAGAEVDVAILDDGGGESLSVLLGELRRLGVRPSLLDDRAPSRRRPLLVTVFSEVRHSKGRVTLDPALVTRLQALRAAAPHLRVLSIGCPQALTGLELPCPTWLVFDRDVASLTAAAEALAGITIPAGQPWWLLEAQEHS